MSAPDDDLKSLVDKARDALEAMSLEEQRAMMDAQRRSFVLAEAGFGSDANEAEYRGALASGDADRIQRCKMAELDRIERASAFLARLDAEGTE